MGLVDLRTRQCDSGLGRFLTPDPLGPQNGNGSYVSAAAAACWVLAVLAIVGIAGLGGVVGLLPALFFTYCAVALGYGFATGQRHPGAERVNTFFAQINAAIPSLRRKGG
jgi:hypothetical protein